MVRTAGALKERLRRAPLVARLSENARVQRFREKGPVPRERFASPLHSERTASVLGICLGITFTVCFLTGILSHYIQHPPSWFTYPSRPLNLYRITQGIHVTTGIASIPLLVAKLWTVYPRFWSWPPVESVGHAIERITIIPLVAGALFQLWSGVADIFYWYSPMPFNFTVVHFWVAWITIGALVIHVGAKIGTARLALRRTSAGVSVDSPIGTPVDAGSPEAPPIETELAPSPVSPSSMSRRELLVTVGATSAILVGAVAGETLVPLRSVAVLAPRDISEGPQKLPVNQSAEQADVISAALDPSFRLTVVGDVRRELSLSVEELLELPAREAGLPITCVEGWSVAARWKGISIGRILSMAGARSGARCEVVSLQAPDRLYRSSLVNEDEIADPDTLIAYQLNGERLDLDHGYPIRLIGPDRPGVMQTKWVHQVVVL